MQQVDYPHEAQADLPDVTFAAMREVADAVRWSDGDVGGSLPPNFHFVRVVDVSYPSGEYAFRLSF